MQLALTLVAAQAADLPAAQERVELALSGMDFEIREPKLLGPNAMDLTVTAGDGMTGLVREASEAALKGLAADVCVQAPEGRRKRLLVADMDSTIIGCECIDELADFAGVKDKVSAITERAMRGEIDFEGALRERVAMLAGLPLADLQRCFDQRVRLNAGARTLIATMTAHDGRCVLVSGGFSFFTGRVAALAGFAAHRANRLVEGDGALTGQVEDPILGREAKLAALQEEAEGLGIKLSQTLAVGDGANDLAMIEAAGLGVAYRAKPVVAAQAHARVDHADLTTLLYFQGYSMEDFSS